MNTLKDINTETIIKIERLYVKELNCKLPHAPNVFENPEFKESKIESNMEINIKSQGVGINKFEITLHAIITGKSKNISLFNLDVQQSGIFIINVPQAQLEDIIKNYCAPILHPYLSQVVTHTIVQAGLPPVILQPIQPIINNSKVLQLNPAEKIIKKNVDSIPEPMN